MTDFLIIFISGITGVFLGMLLLYGSIKITSKITDKLMAKNQEKI